MARNRKGKMGGNYHAITLPRQALLQVQVHHGLLLLLPDVVRRTRKAGTELGGSQVAALQSCRLGEKDRKVHGLIRPRETERVRDRHSQLFVLEPSTMPW
jgi:hypothetical protein